MISQIKYSPNAWLDYIYWQKTDKSVQQLIDQTIEKICNDPYGEESKAIQLKFDLSEIWSRRIDLENRIVYRVVEDTVEIVQCKYHYI
ncbi:Txe/YoeB family addiction module toxin [Reichenbachiella versicolor]|uniref:Txe/YoeB family addiction module toxin n=1 Tax=Reichenbachiella versicolor TaxID=1821036 RepID=UPI000D6DED27|nr:Txe/YoeB family addiction module toxin [Reichenbachiella versicolor]